MEGGINLQLLGAVQVTRNSESVQGFESHKALALLCYLAEQHRPILRSHLVDLFWGDKSEAQGRANLSRVLHNNSALLPGCLLVARTTVQFLVSTTNRVDVATFTELVAQGELASLAAAVELYLGDFMAGTRLNHCSNFETWLVTEQELWRQRVAAVLYQLIARHQHNGDYDQGLPFAKRLLALDPWREDAHRQLMLMLALSGQRIAALRQYESCRQILAEELAVEPGAETTTLYNRIRVHKHISHTIGKAMMNGAHSPEARPAPTRQRTVNGIPKVDLKPIIDRIQHPTCRLLTLVGSEAGVLSQLAQQIVAEQLPLFHNGAYMISLANGCTADALLSTLADALNFSYDNAQSLTSQLFKHLREKEILLVIAYFDPNLERVSLFSDILKRAPGVKMIVMANAVLNLDSEWIFEL